MSYGLWAMGYGLWALSYESRAHDWMRCKPIRLGRSYCHKPNAQSSKLIAHSP
jgi:hypothetical protein